MIDQDLLTELQFALLEPPDGGSSWPSEVWTREEVINTVNRAEQNLLRETYLLVSRTEILVAASATSIDLPTDWIATLACAWRTTGNLRTPVLPADAYEVDTDNPDWELQSGTPLVYLDSDSASLKIRVSPIPAAAGTLELLYVVNPTPVNGNGRSFMVSDTFISGIKYDALDKLLSKVGRLQDPERAAYCRQRRSLIQTASEILLKGFA